MLSLGDRLRLATRALVGLFDERSASAAHGLLSGVWPAAAGAPPKRGTREQLAAYAEMPWLLACGRRIAEVVASTQWQLFYVKAQGAQKAHRVRALQRAKLGVRKGLLERRRDEGDLVEVADHLMLDVLDAGNSFLTGQAMLEVTQLHIDIVGEAFWVKERNGLGAPIGVWPVPSNWILATPTPKFPFYRISFRGWQGVIPDTEILWMPKPRPENPYDRGVGVATALSDELEADEYAAKFMRQRFFNQARPDFIVYPKGQDERGRPAQMKDPEVKRLEQDWTNRNQGFWRAFKPQFLSREVGIFQFDTNDMRQMQMVQMREHERDTILQVFGVPPEILGVISNSNRSTIDVAEYHFAKYVITPRLEFLRTMLQERLVPEFDERLILDYVSPIQEDKAFALQAGVGAPYTLRVDEWRELQGRQPLDNDEGQVFMVPFGLRPVKDLSEAPPPAPMPFAPAGTLPGPNGDAPPANGDRPPKPPAATDEPAKAFKALVGPYAEWLRSLVDDIAIFREASDWNAVKGIEARLRSLAADPNDLPALVRAAERLEPELRRRFLAAIERLRGQVDLRALEEAVRSGHTTALEAVTRVDQLASTVLPEVTPSLHAGFMLGAAEANEALLAAGMALHFDRVNPAAVAWVRAHGAELVTGLEDGSLEAIRAILTQGFTARRTPYQIAQSIRDVIGLTEAQGLAVESFRAGLLAAGVDAARADERAAKYGAAQLRYRAMTIARTETMTASNQGQQSLWREARNQGFLIPDETMRRWIVTEDDRLCPQCEALDGEEVGLEEAFSAGVMIAPLHPLCRCTVTLHFQRKSVAHVLTTGLERISREVLDASRAITQVKRPIAAVRAVVRDANGYIAKITGVDGDPYEAIVENDAKGRVVRIVENGGKIS